MENSKVLNSYYLSKNLKWDQNQLDQIDALYHASTPTTKLYYPEPYIASPSYIHNDIWYMHILVYWYWLWFFFISLIVFFLIVFLSCLRWCNPRLNPKKETRGVSRSKCGDVITCLIPVTWAISIIISETTDSIDYFDGSKTTELVVGIRAYQWGWEYYYPKDLNSRNSLKPTFSEFIGSSLKYSSKSKATGQKSVFKEHLKLNNLSSVNNSSLLLLSPFKNYDSKITKELIKSSPFKVNFSFKNTTKFIKTNPISLLQNLNLDGFNNEKRFISLPLSNYNFLSFKKNNLLHNSLNINSTFDKLTSKSLNKITYFFSKNRDRNINSISNQSTYLTKTRWLSLENIASTVKKNKTFLNIFNLKKTIYPLNSQARNFNNLKSVNNLFNNLNSIINFEQKIQSDRIDDSSIFLKRAQVNLFKTKNASLFNLKKSKNVISLNKSLVNYYPAQPILSNESEYFLSSKKNNNLKFIASATENNLFTLSNWSANFSLKNLHNRIFLVNKLDLIKSYFNQNLPLISNYDFKLKNDFLQKSSSESKKISPFDVYNNLDWNSQKNILFLKSKSFRTLNNIVLKTTTKQYPKYFYISTKSIFEQNSIALLNSSTSNLLSNLDKVLKNSNYSLNNNFFKKSFFNKVNFSNKNLIISSLNSSSINSLSSNLEPKVDIAENNLSFFIPKQEFSTNLLSLFKKSYDSFSSNKKVFKNKISDSFSFTSLEELNKSFINIPLVNSKEINLSKVGRKNTQTFEKKNLYKVSNYSLKNSNLNDISNLNNFNHFFPFLVSKSQEQIKYVWFDWYSKWDKVEAQQANFSVLNLNGLKKTNSSDLFVKNYSNLNSLETYLSRLITIRKSYSSSNNLNSNLYYKKKFSSNYLSIFYLNNEQVNYKNIVLNSMFKKFILFKKNQTYINVDFSLINSIENNKSKQMFNLYSKENKYLYEKKKLLKCFSKKFFLKSYIYKLNRKKILFDKNIYLSSKYVYLHELEKLYRYNYSNSSLLKLNSSVMKSQYKPLRRGISNMVRIQTSNVISLPIETRIQILASSKDIIHSWAIPSAGVKIDCIPGYSSHRIIYFLLSGIYWGQCMEICGRYHHWMPIIVYFIKKDIFFLWCNHFVNSNKKNYINNFKYQNKNISPISFNVDKKNFVKNNL